MKYFFILGRNPTLSSVELISFINNHGYKFSLRDASKEVFLIEIEKEINAKETIKSLGGTIKAGEIVEEAIELKKENIFKIFNKVISQSENRKIYFGFSSYNLEEKDGKSFFEAKKRTASFAMEVKKFLKEKGFSSRWVTGKEDNLSSVIVAKNKLLEENGAEIVILSGRDRYLLGKTFAVQEFEELSFRDFGRPKRNMQVGLMPPKLAQIMINLAEVKKDGVILDPFCGFGTVLGEAMLLGYKNLIGSDISEEVLDGAKENLEWLKNNYQPITDNQQLRTNNYQLIKSDARNVSSKLGEKTVDAIITEPYLGPSLHGKETKENILGIVKDLSMLYLDSFHEFKKILKPNGKIVILFPVFSFQNEEIFTPILEEIKKIGFDTANPLPEDLRNKNFVKITPRNSIIYSRPGQKVLREVLVFRGI
jgi:tRNA G10  N-methylase Trm11